MLYIIACRKSVYIFSMRVDSYEALLLLTWCRCAQLFIKYIYGWNKVKEWNMIHVMPHLRTDRERVLGALANQELKLPSPIQFEAWTPPDTGSGAFPSLRKLSYSSSRSKMCRSCRQDAPKMWKLLWPAASMESFSQETSSEPLTPCTPCRFL